eukprot:737068-Prymnesium_polylepis.1
MTPKILAPSCRRRTSHNNCRISRRTASHTAWRGDSVTLDIQRIDRVALACHTTDVHSVRPPGPWPPPSRSPPPRVRVPLSSPNLHALASSAGRPSSQAPLAHA